MNQDAILAGPTVFAVADGIGGHAAGEIASRITVDRLASLKPSPRESDVLEALSDANARIRAEGRPGSGREGMGTTVSGLALAHDDGTDGILVFNVGDSRTYHADTKGLHQVTVDHSLVAEMVRSGRLTADEAHSHPASNVLTRALGIQPDVQVDHWWLRAAPSERYLVCSDGLTNEVSEGQVAALVAGEQELQVVVDRLLELALDAGARDNVSIVVVEIEAR
jgi:protein phosphatase